MMMSEPVVGVAVVTMSPDLRRRAAMMMSEPVVGVAVVIMMVVHRVRRSWLFRESQRPGEQNYKCGQNPNN
jgi:hypothetical protein